MKYRLKLNCTCEEIFEVISGMFKDDFLQVKGRAIKEDELVPGFTYFKMSNRQAYKNEADNVAEVTLLEYKYPEKYRFSFKSNTFYRIIGLETKPLTDDWCEIIYEEYNEKLNDGKSEDNFAYDGSKVKIERPSLTKWLMFRNTVKEIKKRRK
ncbi:MAG: DUF3284 domain-containing protein [Erysipelotrichaceae bacterium]|nr:DUF3284 domain-containing protein [Erysipelotrichaceae bacterium]